MVRLFLLSQGQGHILQKQITITGGRSVSQSCFPRERREKDKSAIMTMVFRQAPPGHATRQPEDDVILAVSNTTKNVIHYQKASTSKEAKKFEFPVVSALSYLLSLAFRLSPCAYLEDCTQVLMYSYFYQLI